MSINYKDSGVDVEAGEQLVDWIKSEQQNKQIAHKERILSGVGGFAALFDARFPDYKFPCLVSATDGVGTKLKLATHFNSYKEVAQDMVAMCVNDLICCGARPLFFLDYFSTGKLVLDQAKDFISGVQSACEKSQCALVGGETAEMPGLYSPGEFDCAGFAVGIVDKEHVLGKHKVKLGDEIIGLPSSGFHSNGFSLIRKLFADDLDEHKDLLLQPTELYVEPILKLISRADHGIHAMAHITGGGIDNILRVVPKKFSVKLKSWPMPAAFIELEKRSKITRKELLSTLNCGIGFVLIASADKKLNLTNQLNELNINSIPLGTVIESDENKSTWFIDHE